MAVDGSKALFVLRLALERLCSTHQGACNVARESVLRSTGRPGVARSYVTTALRASPDASSSTIAPSYLSSAHQSTWGPRHAASDIEYPSTEDFLEQSFLDDVSGRGEGGCEYQMASMTLPPRHVAPIRWPYYTSESAIHPDSAEAHVPRRCDTLASLVVSGDLKTARIVYDELIALHIGILRRGIYLAPSIACIDGTPAGLDSFLFWFNLVPNRPAMRAHIAFKSTYTLLIDNLLKYHANNPRAHVQVLIAAAHKGVLPAIFGPLMRHLAYLLPPQTLVKVTESVWATFTNTTTSQASQKATSSVRAEAHAVQAKKRVDEGWNALVRALAAAGYERQAGEVVKRQRDVEWQGTTVGAMSADRADVETLHADIAPADPATVLTHLPRIVRTAHAARRADLKPKALAELLDTLSTLRPSLARRLVHRYESPTTLPDPDDGTAALVSAKARREKGHVMAERLSHARMLAYRDKIEHAQVVERFREAFHWVGIPDHPSHAGLSALASSNSGNTEQQGEWSWLKPSRPIKAKLYPTSVHLTTLFPSLLHVYNDTSGNASTHALAFIQSLRHSIIADRLSFESPLPGGGGEDGAVEEVNTDLGDIVPPSALAHPLPPRLLPLPTTFSVLARTVCHLYGPKAGRLMLDQAEELIAALLRPLPGHGHARTQANPGEVSIADDAQQATTVISADPAAPTLRISNRRRLPFIPLTTPELHTLQARISLAQALVPSIDQYNALLFSLAGHARIERLATMLGEMYDEKPIAASAQRTLIRMYGQRLQPGQPGHSHSDWDTNKDRGMGMGQDGVQRERLGMLDSIKMPRPGEKSMLGVAGVLERAGKVEEAERIRAACRAM